MQVFGPEWFRQHQRRLVRFANTNLGRCVFGIPSVPVIGISPAGFSFIKGLNLKDGKLICGCKASGNGLYAKRLRKYGAPFWWILHALDFSMLDHQRLIPSFGFHTLYRNPAAGETAYYDNSFQAVTGVPPDPGVAYATVIANVGYWVAVSATASSIYVFGVIAGQTAGLVLSIKRGGFNFDTTSIGKAAHITEATFYGYEVGGGCPSAIWEASANNDIVFVPWSPDSISVPSVNDFNKFSTTVLGSLAWTGVSGYWGNGFTGGKTISLLTTAVQKAAATSLMAMARGDSAGITPNAVNWVNTFYYIASADYGSSLPLLTVTYEYPVKVNISDAWKEVSDIQVNIGDTWKSLSELKINISDVWKTVF